MSRYMKRKARKTTEQSRLALLHCPPISCTVQQALLLRLVVRWGFTYSGGRSPRWQWVLHIAGGAHLRVARHSGSGLAPPSCGSTRWRWARSTFVWLDTLAVGSVPPRVARHAGGGFVRRHVPGTSAVGP